LTEELNIHLTDLETGKVSELTHWTQYAVISDLMNPASTFNATLGATQYQREITAAGGQKAQVFSYGALQATAIVDERSEATAKSNTDLQISGRGVGGLLLDNVVDSKLLSLRNRTLKQVTEDITQEWQPDWITSVVTNMASERYLVSGTRPSYTTTTKKSIKYTDANGKPTSGPVPGGRQQEVNTPVRKRVKGTKKKFGKDSPVYRGLDESLKQTRIQPEDKVWSVISALSKQIATHPYVGADGALALMRPAYTLDSSVYGEGIVQLWDRRRHKAMGGNVLRSQYETSIAGRHSEIQAWSKGKANKTTMGKALMKHVWSVKDPGPAFWVRTATGGLGAAKLHKPDRAVFKNLRNEKLIKRRCRTLFEDRLMASFSLEYELPGHTINGVMPIIDSMIPVHDERYGLVGENYYITRVERKMDYSGRSTVLKLIPPEIWLHFDHDTTDDATYEAHMIDRVFW
jgi:prophage tail gpP-like protein